MNKSKAILLLLVCLVLLPLSLKAQQPRLWLGVSTGLNNTVFRFDNSESYPDFIYHTYFSTAFGVVAQAYVTPNTSFAFSLGVMQHHYNYYLSNTSLPVSDWNFDNRSVILLSSDLNLAVQRMVTLHENRKRGHYILLTLGLSYRRNSGFDHFFNEIGDFHETEDGNILFTDRATLHTRSLFAIDILAGYMFRFYSGKKSIPQQVSLQAGYTQGLQKMISHEFGDPDNTMHFFTRGSGVLFRMQYAVSIVDLFGDGLEKRQKRIRKGASTFWML